MSTGPIDLMLLPSREVHLGQQQIEFYSEPLLYLPRDGGFLAGSDTAIRISEAGEDLILTVDVCGLRPVTGFRSTQDRR